LGKSDPNKDQRTEQHTDHVQRLYPKSTEWRSCGCLLGYLLIWIGSISVYTLLSELSSMAPTAGGQYQYELSSVPRRTFVADCIRSWVAILAPASYRKFLSYITGWVTLIGWQATTASQAYILGSTLQSCIMILHDDYTPKPYQAMLMGWTVLALAVIINTVGSKTLTHFEGRILILHILGFVAILIPLVYLSAHNDASMFTTFVNS
jgi:choline transport protein